MDLGQYLTYVIHPDLVIWTFSCIWASPSNPSVSTSLPCHLAPFSRLNRLVLLLTSIGVTQYSLQRSFGRGGHGNMCQINNPVSLSSPHLGRDGLTSPAGRELTLNLDLSVSSVPAYVVSF
jgi:hypothetical protein